jgi:hypothetical protein
MDFYRVVYAILMVTLALDFMACAPKKKKVEAAVAITEEAFCTPTTAGALTNPVVITGTAQFQAYQASASGLGNPTIKPIRYAEVRLLDAVGNISQCGQTSNTGVYSFQVENPTASSNYTVQVNSRANNEMVKASILSDITTKAYYSITKSVTLTTTVGTANVEALTAGVTGNIEGGAFNILEQVLKTNEFLKNNTTTGSCSLCQGFTVVPKVTIYWKKGFNPYAYSGEPDTPLSFFDIAGALDATPSLYILGGINGDVDSSDTDQFDNSVIIHEYGHFLESKFSRSDNPGGSHSGNMIVDPRLAWSEGLCNFLPSAVTGSTYYIDTMGNPNGTTKANIYINVESLDGNDSIATKTQLGEGVYREISVSRALYDYIDGHADVVDNPSGGTTTENSNLSFAYIWAAWTHPDYGIGNAKNHFISMGHFNAALKNILTTLNLTTELSNFDVARKGEFQTDDTSEYALELKTPTSSSCAKTMTPAKSVTYFQSLTYPNLFLSSDFYTYYHVGGSLQLSLVYTPTDANNSPDLDLYLFTENYVLDDSSTLVGHADNYRNTESPTGTEAISLSSLAPGYYMIMVQAYTTTTFSGGSANYNLKIGDNYLCQ